MYQKYSTLLATPRLLLNLNKIKSKVHKKVGTLDVKYTVDKEPIPFEERQKRELKPLKKGNKWAQLFDCAWMNFTGVIPSEAKGQKVVLLIDLDGEGCLFDNKGNPQKGLDVMGDFLQAKSQKALDVCDNAVAGQIIDIWIEAVHNSHLKNYALLKQADIAIMREDINALYYDYLTLLFMLTTKKKNSNKYVTIKKALTEVMKIIGNFSTENIIQARNELANIKDLEENTEYRFHACGQAHLDLAWLWPIRQIKRKIGRTFSTQIYNIEKYPSFIFGASQPQQLEWLKTIYPNLHKKVKKSIKDNRIEPQGKMWVECDTNIPSGESLIRQSLYGEKFWLSNYNKSSKICWLPNVLGFSGNLPQIIKKCGMDYFLTTTMNQNEHNKFPHNTFVWEGIDQTQILAHIPPESHYNIVALPVTLNNAATKNSEKHIAKDLALLYGISDSGNGPSGSNIECVLRLHRAKQNLRVKFSAAQELFNELEYLRTQLPLYSGELYLEKHQGILTSQAKNKYYNRLSERNLHNLEFLATYAHITKGVAYPYVELEKIWKEVLLYQSHSIISGASIKRVYDESVTRYIQFNEELVALTNKILKIISSSKDQLCATNLTSYDREEFLKHGERFYMAKVPAYGSAELIEIDELSKIEEMENDILKIAFNNNGEIISLYHKQLEKEFCNDYLNRLSVYNDKKPYHNWQNISHNYMDKKPKRFKLISYQQYQVGNSIVRENLYKYKSSTLTQNIILTMGKPYVEFDTSIEWQETHKMLRADFAPKVYSDEVVCDIQFGNIKRSTKNQSSHQKAQFEIAAHKWIALSNDGYGISLLNDCKYGHRVKEGIISLNLLRSPMWPAKDADKGIHSFRYGLYPYSGDHITANVAKYGYLFNNPLLISNTSFDSFIKSSDNHIIIETVKMAENKQKEIILRAYENSGTKRTTSFTLNCSHKETILTDMLENDIKPIALHDLEFQPFEVKTIKIKL